MFTINESFKKEYEQFLLTESENDINLALEELEEGYNAYSDAFQTLQEYFKLYPLEEDIEFVRDTGAEPTVQSEFTASDIEAAVRAKDARRTAELNAIAQKYSNENFNKVRKEKNAELANDMLRKMGTLIADGKDGEMYAYSPEAGMAVAKKVSEMKFPQNIIFFIQQIIQWVGKFLLSIINKITNGIRRLVGLDTKEQKVDVSMQLAKLKKLSIVGTPTAGSTPQKYVTLSYVDADKLATLNECKTEEEINSVVLNEAETISLSSSEVTKRIPIITMNLADNFEDMNLIIDKFFEVFDNSYGSMGEYLFSTEDLELVLKQFQVILTDLKKGNLPSYALSGKTFEQNQIDRDRLLIIRDKTLINTDKLKDIYTQLKNKCLTIVSMIANKRLMAAVDMAGAYKFYSAATYEAMEKILKVLEVRLSDAEKMEKKLNNMKTAYDKITVELRKQSNMITNLLGSNYQFYHQQLMSNLLESSRIMTQLTTLRMATLSLYIKCLKDIQQSIYVVNDQVGVKKKKKH